MRVCICKSRGRCFNPTDSSATAEMQSLAVFDLFGSPVPRIPSNALDFLRMTVSRIWRAIFIPHLRTSRMKAMTFPSCSPPHCFPHGQHTGGEGREFSQPHIFHLKLVMALRRCLRFSVNQGLTRRASSHWALDWMRIGTVLNQCKFITVNPKWSQYGFRKTLLKLSEVQYSWSFIPKWVEGI